jgi:hypothetical protein
VIASLLSSIFGCAHKRTTFPLTPSKRSQLTSEGTRKGTYVVCLDCGREFNYNWKEMRVGEAVMPPDLHSQTSSFETVNR